jgi:hypothetical protein
MINSEEKNEMDELMSLFRIYLLLFKILSIQPPIHYKEKSKADSFINIDCRLFRN